MIFRMNIKDSLTIIFESLRFARIHGKLQDREGKIENSQQDSISFLPLVILTFKKRRRRAAVFDR